MSKQNTTTCNHQLALTVLNSCPIWFHLSLTNSSLSPGYFGDKSKGHIISFIYISIYIEIVIFHSTSKSMDDFIIKY